MRELFQENAFIEWVDFDEHNDNTNQDNLKSHQDSNPIKGLSLLVPKNGADAFFGASNRDEFCASSDNLPDMLWLYGPGDIIIIRQRIASINGRSVGLDQVHHAALSLGTRNLLTVDFLVTT